MTKKQALAFITYQVETHGAREGCQMVADHLGIDWETVYAWYRRDSVPQWRVDALAKARPAVLGATQAGG